MHVGHIIKKCSSHTTNIVLQNGQPFNISKYLCDIGWGTAAIMDGQQDFWDRIQH